MTSLDTFFTPIRALSPNPAQPFSVRSYVERFVNFPVSMDRFLRVAERGFLAQLGGDYAKLVNTQDMNSDTLVGLADIHTHPAANYGFGCQLFYGDFQYEPPLGSNCSDYHGSYDVTPGQPSFGNFWRHQIAYNLANPSPPPAPNWPQNYDDHFAGWPDFPQWPNWHDPLHQQVHVDMLERAYQGGLRLLVALAVNNHTMAVAAQTDGPYDDQKSGDLQISWLKTLSGPDYPWLEIAYSPSDLRRIIGEGKLAIILGVELDCIGNFYSPLQDNSGNNGGSFNPAPTDDQICAEVSRLFEQGVRYFFPVHVVDNIFGGAAFYETQFDIATKFETGSWYSLEPAPGPSNISYTGDSLGDWKEWLLVFSNLGINLSTVPTPPPTKTGLRNARGLKHEGFVLLDALMRVGAMIDIDHMCENTVMDTLAFTSQVPLSNNVPGFPFANHELPQGDSALPPGVKYPVSAGHNYIREGNGNERAHLISVEAEVLSRGGMFGIGLTQDLAKVHETISDLRTDPVFGTKAGGIAFGSDCSGLSNLPGPNQNQANLAHPIYNDGQHPERLTQYKLVNRTEDIVEGFSHIGMYPDFIEQGVLSNDKNNLTNTDITELFKAPEAFASAWESCLKISSQMH